ncbi:MAG: hypothetical protein K2P52_08510 [Campylobacterales bacterium]|nr:hypothetical protein [Campylobacterales bacterium]
MSNPSIVKLFEIITQILRLKKIDGESRNQMIDRISDTLVNKKISVNTIKRILKYLGITGISKLKKSKLIDTLKLKLIKSKPKPLPKPIKVEYLDKYVITANDFVPSINTGKLPINVYFPLKRLIDKNASGKLRLILVVNDLIDVDKSVVYNNDEEVDKTYIVPSTKSTKRQWYETENIEYDWWGERSGHSIFESAAGIWNEKSLTYKFNPNVKVTFMILKPTDLTSMKIAQKFAYGIQHCVFNPLIQLCDNKIIESKKNKVIEKYNTIKNKCVAFIEEYKDGVPEDKLQNVADILNVNISISDLLGREFIFIKSNKRKPLLTCNYVNSKINHVEFTNMMNIQQKDAIELPQDILNKKFKEVYSNPEEIIIYQGSKDNIFSFTDKTHKYILDTSFDSYKTAEDEFLIESGLNKCKLDYINQPELYNFIKESTYIPSSIDYIKNFYEIASEAKKHNKLREIDGIKAYTNYKQAGEFYRGFPALYSDMCKVPELKNKNDQLIFLKNHIGTYRIENIDLSKMDINKQKHFKHLNIFNQKLVNECSESGNNLDFGIETTKTIETMNIIKEDEVIKCLTLASPILEFLLHHNVTFDIKYGAISPKTIDFDVNNTMKQNKIFKTEGDRLTNTGVSYYSKFFGKCMRADEYSVLKTRCDLSLANQISSLYRTVEDSNIVYYKELNELMVEYKKKYADNLIHITSFITSYLMINMFNQLFNMDAEKILRVNIDGIYFIDHEFTKNNMFQDKPCRVPMNETAHYYFNHKEFFDPSNLPEYQPFFRINGHFGPGGSGKTHWNLKYNGYTDRLYVSTTRKLVKAKKEEYKCKGMTLARLLERGCVNKMKTYPSVIIVDECTMLTNNDKKEIINKYLYSKIIFCGDMNKDGLIYQLPSFEGKPFNVKQIEYFKQYTTIHRTNDEQLLYILSTLRDMIEQNTNVNIAVDWIKKQKNINIVTIDDVKKLYDINDYILSSKHKFVDAWTNIFKGTFSQEKYYVKKTSTNYDNGSIIISDKQPINSIIQHAFTIHSVQGETCITKLFIDTRNIFGDVQMLYTAISRAKFLKNIYFI